MVTQFEGLLKGKLRRRSGHLLFFLFFSSFRVALVAYGDSQARGPIGSVAIGLRQSYSKLGSELCLPPTPQLTARPNP